MTTMKMTTNLTTFARTAGDSIATVAGCEGNEMNETVTIELPLPHKSLSPNARTHWATKSRQTKAARNLSGYTMLCEMQKHGLDSPMWIRAVVQCRFYFRTKRNRDADNCLAWCKAYFDGIADVKLIGNDSGFNHLPVEILVDKMRPRLVIEVTKGAA